MKGRLRLLVIFVLPIFPSIPILRAASALPIPTSGVYLGVWADPNSARNQEAAIELLEAPSGINRPFALHLSYYGWTDLSQLLNSAGMFQPDTNLQGDIAHGRVPVISWTCDRKTTDSDHVIAAGDPTEDANITATAKALAQYPGPVLLRWFWEFNLINANDGNQPCRNDNGTAPTQQVYSDFIGAWQHIYQLFQTAGATNVVFLWNPGHYTDGNPNDPHSYYPGNAYVDWIGIDSYQRAPTETFTSDFGEFYADFSASQFGGKPLMVGENASANDSVYNAELQPAYLNGILADLTSNLYPLLKAYDYFDAGSAPNDWVLDPQGLSALATVGGSPAFLPAPALTSAAHGATYYPGGLVPGSWAFVKGTGLSNVTRIWNSADFSGNNLPKSLSGVQLTVNGVSAAIYYISSSQINFQVPAGITGPAAIQVRYGGASSNALTSTAVAGAPGLFPNIQGPSAYPLAVFLDGTYVGSRAAKPGDVIVLFATGLEAEAAGIVPTVAAIQGVTVTLGTMVIPASYAGQTAYVGDFQINFTVPNLSAGSYVVSIQLNNVSSPQTVNTTPQLPLTIPIQ